LAIPLPYLVTGAIAAAAFGLLSIFALPLSLPSPDIPHMLALVHMATPDWLTMTIMGASVQLVPVIVVAPCTPPGPCAGSTRCFFVASSA
jgi:hypothetical protein